MPKTREIRQAIILLLAGILTMLFIVMSSTAFVSAASVKIGQATNGEGGKLTGCRAGDQSGSEVTVCNWSYSSKPGSSYHWVYVFRAKDPAVAKAIAANMKAAAANNHIGYDKKNPDRCSFYDQAKKNNWNIASITTNCETTCASAVSVCLNAAGVNVPRMWYSGIVYKGIMKTGQFYCYTSSDYTASCAKLLPGDILCNPKRHTAMVVESPNAFQYDVTYQNTSGKTDVARVEEGNIVELNLNNGQAVTGVKVDKAIDLKKYQPKKNGHTFKGWKQVGENSFSAQFDSSLASIQTSNDSVQLDK